MPMMNGQGPPQGTGPRTGRQQGVAQRQAGGQQQQLIQRFRQMDHEELSRLALQLFTALRQMQMRQQQPQTGGQQQQQQPSGQVMR